MLLRAYLDERRRPWRRETTTPGSAAFDHAVVQDPGAEQRVVLLAALGRLTRRHRAVLILRFWLDLPVEQVAEALGCQPGTPKGR